MFLKVKEKRRERENNIPFMIFSLVLDFPLTERAEIHIFTNFAVFKQHKIFFAFS